MKKALRQGLERFSGIKSGLSPGIPVFYSYQLDSVTPVTC